MYDGGSYTPVAKLTEEDSYSIVQDYLGTPIQALDSKGEVVWDCILDIYGDVLELRGERNFIAFRFQGMYYDTETELCYVRHRYYPLGKQKGTGLTSDERAAFNKWKQEYWKSQAEAELKARGKK